MQHPIHNLVSTYRKTVSVFRRAVRGLPARSERLLGNDAVDRTRRKEIQAAPRSFGNVGNPAGRRVDDTIELKAFSVVGQFDAVEVAIEISDVQAAVQSP